MTTTTSLTVRNENANEGDMFPDLEPISAFTVKKIDLATQLNALMVFSGKTRSDMAAALGWKKSQVTRVLSGKNNFTVKTIWDFSSYLGFDFDIVFHESNHTKPKQPWQIQRVESTNIPTVNLNTLSWPIEAQSAQDVAIDFRTGNQKKYYFSFKTETNTKTIETTPQVLPATIYKDLIPTVHDLPVAHNVRR